MNTDPRSPKSALLRNLNAHAVLDSLADGAYITDVNRRIVFWNRAAERITGWPAHEVVGRSQPPISRPPVRPNGCSRGLPSEANS